MIPKLIDRSYPLFIIAAIVLLIVALFSSSGCKSEHIAEFKYKDGLLAEAMYKESSGFHFFSEGANKTLSPSLSVNGVSF
ncbi:MAG: hypothetical protein A2X49_05755 [Lentisphaerae bacterium GWF2_52_8]|nr:MAG: hypothetical protein A2X49_05755 [Lentisphaerae bacterium GWF2_52_8]